MPKSRIFITGDTHFNFDIGKFNNFLYTSSPQPEDYLIILGDAGIVWYPRQNEYELDLLEFYKDLKCQILVVPGNHENYTRLERDYPLTWFQHRAPVRKISDNIMYLERGAYFELNGATFWAFGGAQSHDKEWRISELDWWEREMPNQDECDRGRLTLEERKGEVNFILTHCAPSSVARQIDETYKPDGLTEYLERIKDSTLFETWWFGHYHTDRFIGDRFKAVYNNIYTIEV